jgi:hypothetical protein
MRLDDLPALLVGRAGDRTFLDIAMGQQCRFDFGPAML